MVVWINILQLCVCVVVSGVETISYSELAMKAVKSSGALLCVACNVVQVAAWFGYIFNESFGSHGHMWQCQECGQATWSS